MVRIGIKGDAAWVRAVGRDMCTLAREAEIVGAIMRKGCFN